MIYFNNQPVNSNEKDMMEFNQLKYQIQQECSKFFPNGIIPKPIYKNSGWLIPMSEQQIKDYSDYCI